ncbi:hybrid sensor histidine kinase/response regulator [Sphingobacterium bovistauri]|uniref:histidine kinase n=1 Tax=Sphingobacterium bovistauri TaxID=2781959 RepID=A0ABS7ZB09_9SPHI|nr:ATP-binding protein [Sphingobacterium bovistauri]MCA5006070.1 response regulator [Sphingobacterium bovistauri]
MIEKGVKSSNRIRTALLFVTITLFLVISTIFFISINYFEVINTRISKLIELTNYKDAHYENALSEFLDAENNFRKYSVNLDTAYYNAYIKHIYQLDKKIEDIINQYRLDTSGTPLDPSAVISFNRYLIIESKLDEIQSLTPLSNSTDQDHDTSILVQPPSTSNLSMDIDKVVKAPQNKNKSLLNKLFRKAEEPVVDKEAIKLYNQNLRNFSNTNYKRFNAFKNSYEILRKSERKLLSNHFTILYSIYQVLLEIDELQIIRQKMLLHDQHEDLLKQSEKIAWQTILCLIFIFILISIMIYYQFRNRFYQKQLVQEQRYAAKLASEKSDILAEISHEIRTPINSLIGIIDLLKKRSNIYSEKEQLFLDSAYSNISNTSRTINDILNLSKIDYSAKPELSDFDIEELALDVFTIHESQAELKKIELEVAVEEDTPTIIHSDELKVRQILTNLISNGIKYTMYGKVTCFIRINELNNLHIKVIDTGLGIPANMQPNIFKKYFTKSNESKLSNGIGLGLYITERIVKQLQGTITFTSKENIGTTFSVEIPIPKAKKKIKSTVEYKSLSEYPNELTWLLVDDNVLNILYLKQFFQTFKHVKAATNGLEALEILKTFVPNIIITDINMPIMTGDEFLVYARQIPTLNDTKIIATSSDYEQIRELEIKRNTFFDNVIIKPFNEKDIVKTINQTLYGDKESSI